jgi:hypothetical protein
MTVYQPAVSESFHTNPTNVGITHLAGHVVASFCFLDVDWNACLSDPSAQIIMNTNHDTEDKT